MLGCLVEPWLFVAITLGAGPAGVGDLVHPAHLNLVAGRAVGHAARDPDLLAHMLAQVIGVGALGQLKLEGDSALVSNGEVTGSAAEAALDRLGWPMRACPE
jgi:hypothetical protein